MNPEFIKVCGMKDPEQIKALGVLGRAEGPARLGMFGMIFYDRSPRFLRGSIEKDLAPSLKRTGVFVNAGVDFIRSKVEHYGLDFIQLHGDEDVAFAREVKDLAPVIKAFRIDADFDFSALKAWEKEVDYFIFDAAGKSYGGNGVKYDWSLLEAYSGETPFLLSGGLAPGDLEVIKSFHHPRCVGLDLNSGFEFAPGDKNIEAIAQFQRALKKQSQHEIQR